MAKRRHIITSDFEKGSLIEYLWEDIKRDYFETVKKELKGVLKEKKGIYALYYRKKLVYVGLATNLYWRTHHHLKSKRLKWDTFSIFVLPTKNLKHLRDLETTVVRIAKPKGNRIEGRLPREKECFLKNEMKSKVREKKRLLRKKQKLREAEIRDLSTEITQIKKMLARK